MRKVYRHKMELLCQLLSPYAPKIHYYSEHSGFYLLIELTETPYSIEQLCQMADNASIRIYPIAHSSRKLFTLGFGNLSKQELREGVEKLLDIILSR